MITDNKLSFKWLRQAGALLFIVALFVPLQTRGHEGVENAVYPVESGIYAGGNSMNTDVGSQLSLGVLPSVEDKDDGPPSDIDSNEKPKIVGLPEPIQQSINRGKDHVIAILLGLALGAILFTDWRWLARRK